MIKPLSERRAQAIMDELVKDGIDAPALKAKGYGSSQPMADNAMPEGPGAQPPGRVPQAVAGQAARSRLEERDRA